MLGIQDAPKVIIIGSSGAGKTSLLSKFADNTFAFTEPPTIGVDFKARHVEYHGKNYLVQFWDTAGQDRFREITSTYYRTAKGIVLVYDITNQKSFDELSSYWIPAIRSHVDLSHISLVLVGNKADLSNLRTITTKQGTELAKTLSCMFLETSALTGENVKEAFVTVGQEAVRRIEPPKTGSISLVNPPEKNPHVLVKIN
eukprot:c2816_g1_i1.p1 GENE.c2816_g1_i1~~c2816_g1_i1.p1  ORF type:complete len:200 (+),score=52.58 c2816_g1_i1:48-647(+)